MIVSQNNLALDSQLSAEWGNFVARSRRRMVLSYIKKQSYYQSRTCFGRKESERGEKKKRF